MRGFPKSNARGNAGREPTAMIAGDLLAYRGETFEVRYFAGMLTTTAVKRADLPVKVVIEMLPRGGRILFTSRDGEHAVNLADRRLDEDEVRYDFLDLLAELDLREVGV